MMVGRPAGFQKGGRAKISQAMLKFQGVIYRGHLNLTHFGIIKQIQMYGKFEGFPLSTPLNKVPVLEDMSIFGKVDLP